MPLSLRALLALTLFAGYYVFLLYNHLEYANLVRLGFRPPLAAGFTRFLEPPIARPIDERTQGAVTEQSPYDSHPPTSERVTALAALPPGGSLARSGLQDDARAIGLVGARHGRRHRFQSGAIIEP